MITINKTEDTRETLNILINADFFRLGLIQDTLIKSLVEELEKGVNEQDGDKTLMLASILQDFMLNDNQMAAIGYALSNMEHGGGSNFVERFNHQEL